MSTPMSSWSWASRAPGRPPSVPCSPPGSASPTPRATTSTRRPTSPRCRPAVPLDDDDRWPWLDAIGTWAHERAGLGGVVSCSALKRSYRDRLRAEAPGVVFVHLSGDRALIEDRMAHRQGHFMPTALLDSQFATLQPLQADEAGVAVDVAGSPEEITRRAVEALSGIPESAA